MCIRDSVYCMHTRNGVCVKSWLGAFCVLPSQWPSVQLADLSAGAPNAIFLLSILCDSSSHKSVLRSLWSLILMNMWRCTMRRLSGEPDKQPHFLCVTENVWKTWPLRADCIMSRNVSQLLSIYSIIIPCNVRWLNVYGDRNSSFSRDKIRLWNQIVPIHCHQEQLF